MKISSFFLWLVLVSCTVSLVGASLLAYWLIWPYQVIEPPKPFVKVLNPRKTVVAGEQLIYESDTVHLTNGVRVTTNRQLVDGFIVSLSRGGYVTDGEHFFGTNLSLTIPAFVPPGDGYYVLFESVFHVNPLRDIIVLRRTEPFTVVAPPDKETEK